MSVIKKTLFDEKLENINVLVNDTDSNSKYFKITELPETFTGGKNAFLIQGSEYLVPDTIIKIQIKDANGDTIYYEPGEGIVSSSVNGEWFVSEYYEGTSKVVAVYIYPNTTIDANGNPLDGTAYGPATITILGELKEYESNGLRLPIPDNWKDTYNVKWTKTVNVNPSLSNTTKIRFYRRPTAKITELLQPLYTIDSGTGLKVDSGISQSFAQIDLSNLETFAGDVKRVKVYRTSEADISDYDLIQDVLLESKELLTSYQLTGSVIGNTGIFTGETLSNYWITGSLTASLTNDKIENGLKLSGSGILRYSQSLDINSANTYELNLDAFYSGTVDSNLGIYLSYTSESTTVSSSIGTLYGLKPTKNLSDSVIPFSIPNNYPTASLYFSQSNGEWHVGNISLKLSEDTAFSPDSISFITTMPTILGNDVFNFKFEFYDLNNNYVPVFVTQSATFVGAPLDTNSLVSASLSQSLDALYKVSSSISGTMTVYSSSASGSITVVSGSVFTLSGSVSSSLYNLSSSVSQSNATILSSSLSKVQQLANGQFSGSFIGDTVIYSPVIGGQVGYIKDLFTVGDTSAAQINLDARTTTRKIYIGTGTYNNSNTAIYLDSGGQFSLKDKLTWDGTNLSVNGTINVTGGNAATDSNAALYAARAAASASISASAAQSNAISTAASDATTKANLAITTSAISASNAALSASTAFTNAKAVADSIANGTYTGGTLISSTSIISPVIAGANGYISNVFKVGNAGITLDGANKVIYIGNGTYGNANTGFYVDNSGNFSLGNKLTFTGGNLSITGNITAGSGTIGPWNIASDSIYYGTKATSGNYASAGNITLGQSWISSANFRIDTDGSAYFNGTINASGGTIAGWVIDSNRIYKSGTTPYGGTGTVQISSANQHFQIYGSGYGAPGDSTLYVGGGAGFIGNSYNKIMITPDYLQIANNQNGSTGNPTGTFTVYSTGTVMQLSINQGRIDASYSSTTNTDRAGTFIGGLYCFNNTTANYGYSLYSAGADAGFVYDVVANLSDARLKENVREIDNALDKVSKIRGVYYNWTDEAIELEAAKDKDEKVGVIAQEIQAVLPQIIKPAPFDNLGNGESKTGEHYITVQYEKLVPLLIEAIKELKVEVDELKRSK